MTCKLNYYILIGVLFGLLGSCSASRLAGPLSQVDLIRHPSPSEETAPAASPSPSLASRDPSLIFVDGDRFLLQSVNGVLQATRVPTRIRLSGQACVKLPSSQTCGWNFTGGYPSNVQKKCRMTSYLPNTNWTEGGTSTYFTNCGTCRDAAVLAPESVESPIYQATAQLRCLGSPLLDEQWRTKYSFRVETLEGACEQVPTFFTFNSCS